METVVWWALLVFKGIVSYACLGQVKTALDWLVIDRKSVSRLVYGGRGTTSRARLGHGVLARGGCHPLDESGPRHELMAVPLGDIRGHSHRRPPSEQAVAQALLNGDTYWPPGAAA